ncbi:MAG TPA: histidine kinase dimerization/phospho-acceptor domain-containing protein [Longimicrobiales bacterium]|nr:histidine kinase dimerization/phospho-acceptor domain-containing protein [Longimicrobiales bacterium]
MRNAPETTDRLREILELVREVRHDMNGPLTSVLGNVQLLLEDPAVTDADTRETLRDIQTDVRRLAGMIRRLSEVQPERTEGTTGA